MPRTLTLTLTPEQEAFLAAQVAGDEAISLEDAARQLIDDAILEQQSASDDFAWIKPLIAEADASLKRGEGMTLEESRKLRRAHLAALESGSR